VIVDSGDTRDRLGCHRNRLPLLFGFDKAPEIDDATRDRNIQPVNMRPRLLLQLFQQIFSDRSVGKADFELGSGARNSLNDVGAADDADQVATLAHDWNALDVILLEKICDFNQRRIGLGRLNVTRHDVLDFPRVGLDVLVCESAVSRNKGQPPSDGALGSGLRSMQQVGLGDDANELSRAIDDRKR
jgi:hypothetical protein